MDDKTEQPLLIFEEKGHVKVGTVYASSMLSAINVAEFGKQVLQYIQKHPGLNLLLNFEHVDYLSSAVLTELLRINNAVQTTKGRLRLCAVAPTIQEVFHITNLDKVFTIHGDKVNQDLPRFERALELEVQQSAWHEPK